MELRIQIVAVLVTAALLFGILELVRSRRLLERYAILWLFSMTALLALAAWKGLLEKISHAVGIYYAPSALFVIAFGFILVLLLHFSTAVSRLTDKSKVLAQRIALMEERQRELEQQLADAAGTGGEVPHIQEPEAPERNIGEPEMFRSVRR